MKEIINIYKPVGMTPLQAIIKFKEKYPSFKDKCISHAGRLDPLAEGVQIMVFDDETRNLKRYLDLDKEYEAKILFGFSSDSHDIQGIPKIYDKKIDLIKTKEIILSLIGKYHQVIPAYSGKKIKGKKLFSLARENKILFEDLPTKKVKIIDLKINETQKIVGKELLNFIIERISILDGDFRQKEIIDSWKNILKDKSNEEFDTINIKINCSTGTYIRSIVEDIGKRLGCGAVLLGLKRTMVGSFNSKDSIKI